MERRLVDMLFLFRIWEFEIIFWLYWWEKQWRGMHQILSKGRIVVNYGDFIRVTKQGIYHHHHHVPEGLGVFPVPWSSRWIWSFHLFLGRPVFLPPFGLYCSACFGILFVSILCTCRSPFSWYCFISFTMFCAPFFPLKHWFISLSIHEG